MPDQTSDEIRIPPLKIAEKDRVEPFVAEAEGSQFKFYVEKLGYNWEFKGRKGMSPRVQVMMVKLDQHGDPTRTRKQINIPAGMSEADLKTLFKNIIAVKDKPFLPAK